MGVIFGKQLLWYPFRRVPQNFTKPTFNWMKSTSPPGASGRFLGKTPLKMKDGEFHQKYLATQQKNILCKDINTPVSSEMNILE